MGWNHTAKLGLALAFVLVLLPHLTGFVTVEEGFCKNDVPRVQVENDIPYLGPERDEKLDLYRPAQMVKGKPYPGIVIIHGGSW